MGALSGSHVWHGGHWPSPQAACEHAAGAPLPNERPYWPHNRAGDQWWVWSEAQRLLTGRGQLTPWSQALRSCWELRTAGDGNTHRKREQGGRQCDRTAKEGQRGIPAIPPESPSLDLEVRVVGGITETAGVAQKEGRNLVAGVGGWGGS